MKYANTISRLESYQAKSEITVSEFLAVVDELCAETGGAEAIKRLDLGEHASALLNLIQMNNVVLWIYEAHKNELRSSTLFHRLEMSREQIQSDIAEIDAENRRLAGLLQEAEEEKMKKLSISEELMQLMKYSEESLRGSVFTENAGNAQQLKTLQGKLEEELFRTEEKINTCKKLYADLKQLIESGFPE